MTFVFITTIAIIIVVVIVVYIIIINYVVSIVIIIIVIITPSSRFYTNLIIQFFQLSYLFLYTSQLYTLSISITPYH